MDPLLSCHDLPVRVAAGSERRLPVTVENPGDATDHYRLEVLGEAGRWARVEPRQVADVPAGGLATATLVVRPPAETSSGRRPLAIRAVSLKDPERCAVVEGELRIGGAGDVDVTAAAVAGRGRHAGHYVLQVANDGSTQADVRLTATDPRHELGFALAPEELTVPAGRSERVYLSVRPRHPKVAGGEIAHPFEVQHRVGAGPEGRLSLRYEQRPVLGRVASAGVALVALAVTGAAGLMLWPTVRDAVSGGDSGSATATTSSPTGTGPTGDDPVQGYYVVWAVQFLDDPVAASSLEDLRDRLEDDGVEVRIVHSQDSEQLQEPDGRESRVLLQDGFSDIDTARAACEARRHIAPACQEGPR